MPRFTTSAAVLGFAASVLAQSSSITSSASLASASTVSAPLLNPGSALVASLVGQGNGLQTLAIQCASDVNSTDCNYPTPLTYTIGSSTIHVSGSIDSLTVDYGCDITGSTTATCTFTEIGPAVLVATDNAVTATTISTLIANGTLAQTDITYYPITITAGLGVVTASSSSRSVSSTSHSSSGSSSSSAASSASRSSSSASASAASSAASSTSSAGAAGSIVAPGFLAAGLLGLAVFL